MVVKINKSQRIDAKKFNHVKGRVTFSDKKEIYTE
jgi:hypothetical protein